MASRIHCRSCFYDLRTVFSGSCPECGRSFDPADPKTFTTLGKAPSLFVGLLLVIGLAVIAFFSIGFAFNLNYVPERHLAFWVIFGIGLTPGITAGILAALNRFLLVRIAMMFVGIFSVWAGLFLASDKFLSCLAGDPQRVSGSLRRHRPHGCTVGGLDSRDGFRGHHLRPRNLHDLVLRVALGKTSAFGSVTTAAPGPPSIPAMLHRTQLIIWNRVCDRAGPRNARSVAGCSTHPRCVRKDV